MMVPKEDLMVLLNEFYLSGVRILTVRVPLPEVELYRIELRKEPVVYLKGVEEYREVYSYEALKSEQEVAGEMPDEREYILVLRSSGVLKPENYAQVCEELLRLSDRDLMRGDRPLYVGFDTSALVSRFPVVMPEINCGVCLNSGVIQELHAKFVESKIGEHEARLLEKRGLREVFNQPHMRVRKFRLGAVEYRKLKRHRYAEEIEGKRGDLGIIEGYCEFQKSRGVDLVVISEDGNFVEVANDRRIKSLHLIPARGVPERVRTGWDEVVELLYVTAVVYGELRIRGAVLRGVWRGKTGEDWNSERLRLEFRDRRLEERMQGNLRILRECS